MLAITGAVVAGVLTAYIGGAGGDMVSVFSGIGEGLVVAASAGDGGGEAARTSIAGACGDVLSGASVD